MELRLEAAPTMWDKKISKWNLKSLMIETSKNPLLKGQRSHMNKGNIR